MNQLTQAIDRFDAYFRSANGVPPNDRISVPTAEWVALRSLLAEALSAQAALQAVQPAVPVPDSVLTTIGWLLDDAMNAAVKNGANSISMPDDYVELAVWLAGIPAHPAEGVPAHAAQPSDALIEAVDAWFAENTGLGGCSDKDVAELAAIFATHPTPQGLDARQWLQHHDFEALERFAETSEDDESYDIGKEAIQRLTHFGCLNSHGFGRYSITAFGSYVLDNWSLARELPFKMQSERDSEHRAALAAQAKQGGE